MILRKHYTIYVCNVSLQDRLTVIRYKIHAYPSHACLISFLLMLYCAVTLNVGVVCYDRATPAS